MNSKWGCPEPILVWPAKKLANARGRTITVSFHEHMYISTQQTRPQPEKKEKKKDLELKCGLIRWSMSTSGSAKAVIISYYLQPEYQDKVSNMGGPWHSYLPVRTRRWRSMRRRQNLVAWRYQSPGKGIRTSYWIKFVIHFNKACAESDRKKGTLSRIRIPNSTCVASRSS